MCPNPSHRAAAWPPHSEDKIRDHAQAAFCSSRHRPSARRTGLRQDRQRDRREVGRAERVDRHRARRQDRVPAARMEELLRDALIVDKPRKKTRTTRAQKQRRLEEKKRRGEMKKLRGRIERSEER